MADEAMNVIDAGKTIAGLMQNQDKPEEAHAESEPTEEVEQPTTEP